MKPKYLKKKKKSVGGLLILIAVIVLVIAIALISMLGSKSEAEETTANTQAATESIPLETEQTEPEVTQTKVQESLNFLSFENGEIQTPFLTLHYPEMFEDYLLIANSSSDPYILEFYAVLPERTEQRIFDICLGSGSDGNLGIVETAAGAVSVSMTVYSFDPDETWTQGEIDTVLAMQEASNELVSNLSISHGNETQTPDFEEAPKETTVVNFLKIETPYCELRYPAVWTETLHTEENENDGIYRVDFYCSLEGHENLLIFSVLLGGDEGEQLGIVTNEAGITVPVNLLMNTPSEEGLQANELEILYSMQEAVNQLIEQLPLR